MISFFLLSDSETRFYEGDKKEAGHENRRHDISSRQRTVSSCGRSTVHNQELDFEVFEHPAYSNDLAPCDFFLYPTLKNVLRGEHFDDADELFLTKKLTENWLMQFYKKI
jgi:hypothetical protein